MKSGILFSILVTMLLVSCKKETPPTIQATEKIAKPKTECYLYDANGSVISLQLNYNENNVSGSLTYGLKEKDSNTGTFTGRLENNILIADYTFQSEGTQSTRQVAFQLKDDKLIEGYGDMNPDGTHFKNLSKLKFTSTMPLSKVKCPE